MNETDSISKAVSEIIDSFDNYAEQFSEADIYDSLRKIAKDKQNDLNVYTLSELLAFSFEVESNRDRSTWNTFYGPLMIYHDGEGNVYMYPDIKQVTPEIIDYWDKRSHEAKHPILKARYADLVWDFSLTISGKSPSYQSAQIAIDNYIAIANERLYSIDVFLFGKLDRALLLALSINDQSRINKVKKSIIAYEANFSEDDKPGLWGHTFDLLLSNKKIFLDEEIDEIVQNMEDRLDRISQYTDQPRPIGIERAATLLARYYRRDNKQDQVERVLKSIEDVYDRVIEHAEPFQISMHLEKLHSIYTQFGLKTNADKLLKKLNQLVPDPLTNLKEISHSIKITNEEMEHYISGLTDHDFETTLIYIISRFTPSLEDTEKRLKEYAKDFPMQFLIPKSIVDDRGIAIAKISSLNDDLDGNICFQISQDLHYYSFFLRKVLDRFKTKFLLNEYNTTDYLLNAPIFNPKKKDMIFHGLKSYFNIDYLSAVSLLIPQIEDVFRNLVEIGGGNILKSPRLGIGFQYKILDELLRDELIAKVFGMDAAHYFRILLTDQRGWNIRNRVCHGLAKSDLFSSKVADRILHVLLCLSQVRPQETH